MRFRSKPMKITQVIHAFPPFSRAGSENYLEALASIQARDHAVSVFHRVAQPDRPEYEVTEDQVGVLPVVRINRTFCDMRSFEETYKVEGVAKAFGAYLDRFQPDVVHFHHITCLSTSCVHEAKARRIPVVYTLHDFWLLCPRGQLMRRDLTLCTKHTEADCVRCLAYQLPIEGGHERIHELWEKADGLRRFKLPQNVHRWMASRPFGRERAAVDEIRARTSHVLEMCGLVDRFISPSQFVADEYVRFGIPAEKLVVADNGFDLSLWEAVPRKRPADSAKLRVAYLGTWIPTKGVHVLIEAFRDLDPARAVLDIHGYASPYDGFEDYEDHLRELAAGAPHIRFGGRYDPESVPELLAAADVMVVPSIWYENSPLTIHEAFLAGVPVVAAGHGGMKEYVEHGVSGLNFKPGNAASLRRALIRLIEDRDLLARFRSKIPAVKDIRENAEEIERIYLDLKPTHGASD